MINNILRNCNIFYIIIFLLSPLFKSLWNLEIKLVCPFDGFISEKEHNGKSTGPPTRRAYKKSLSRKNKYSLKAGKSIGSSFFINLNFFNLKAVGSFNLINELILKLLFVLSLLFVSSFIIDSLSLFLLTS